MKNQVRVSFDVPIEEHTFLKAECAKNRIVFRDLMKEMFHKTVEEMRKKELRDILLQGFKDSYEGRTKTLTDEDLDRWEKLLND